MDGLADGVSRLKVGLEKRNRLTMGRISARVKGSRICRSSCVLVMRSRTSLAAAHHCAVTAVGKSIVSWESVYTLDMSAISASTLLVEEKAIGTWGWIGLVWAVDAMSLGKSLTAERLAIVGGSDAAASSGGWRSEDNGR